MVQSIDSRVVIIGAGQAGAWVAATLRAEGHRGPISLIGDEKHVPYERPPLSKSFLRGETPLEKAFIKNPAFYRESEIVLKLERSVRAIDRSNRLVVLGDGSVEHYDRLVLATGARARRIDLPGADNPRIHYLRNAHDAACLRSQLLSSTSIAILGGGFIGMEVAASAMEMGLDVTVLEQARTLMGRMLPKQVADHLAKSHRDRGVKIFTGERVVAFESEGESVRVSREQGNTLRVDCVAIGVGAIPNTELAVMAGLAVDDGIIVDEFGVTNDRRIMAAGDVTRHFNPLIRTHVRLETWQNAQNQAVAVAKNIVGEPTPYAEVPWLWSDQYNINLQMAGASADWSDAVHRGSDDTEKFSLLALDRGTVVAAITVNQSREMRAARRLISGRVRVGRDTLRDAGKSLECLLRTSV